MWIEIRDDRPGKEEMESRLARALWIEITSTVCIPSAVLCRGSREPCGLKLHGWHELVKDSRRGSREPCGLKFNTKALSLCLGPSRLARALWIEIRGLQVKHKQLMSRLARALWIEISIVSLSSWSCLVEARESLVD